MTQIQLRFRLQSGAWIALLVGVGVFVGVAISIPLTLNLIPAGVVCDGKESLCWWLRFDYKKDLRDL